MLEWTDLLRDGGDEEIQSGEVLIVGGPSAQEFPDALNRIEFGAVRGQEVEPE